MSSAFRPCCALLSLFLACSMNAGAVPGLLKLQQGTHVAGEITVTADGFSVATTNAEPTIVPFADLKSAFFHRTNSVAQTNAADVTPGALPTGWLGVQLGRTNEASAVTHSNGTYHVTGAGLNLWNSNPDAFYYVYRAVTGDCQITARLVGSEARSAGIMLRSGLDGSARFATILHQPQDILAFRARRSEEYRRRMGSEGEWQNRDFVNLPRWVRLVRQGVELRAYLSWDEGSHWEIFYRCPSELPPQVLAGLFVMSGDDARVKSATFDHVTVEPLVAKNLAAQRFQGVVLVNGSVVAGEFKNSDSTTIRLQRGGKVLSIPTTRVARLLFQKAPGLTEPGGFPIGEGAILAADDFLEADFSGIDGDTVRMSSVLFGTRKYRLSQLKAVLLRPITQQGGFIVTTRDGSEWRIPKLLAQEGQLAPDLPLLGVTRLPWSEVRELHRTP